MLLLLFFSFPLLALVFFINARLARKDAFNGNGSEFLDGSLGFGLDALILFGYPPLSAFYFLFLDLYPYFCIFHKERDGWDLDGMGTVLCSLQTWPAFMGNGGFFYYVSFLL